MSVWAAWAAARRLRRQELAEAVLRLRCQAGARQRGAGTRLCVSCGHTVLCAENRVPCALGWDSAPLHILALALAQQGDGLGSLFGEVLPIRSLGCVIKHTSSVCAEDTHAGSAQVRL